MSALTKQERDALEEVFLSIHTNKKMGGLSSLVITSYINNTLYKMIKRAKLGLQKRKRLYFLLYFGKKKKHLSK